MAWLDGPPSGLKGPLDLQKHMMCMVFGQQLAASHHVPVDVVMSKISQHNNKKTPLCLSGPDLAI